MCAETTVPLTGAEKEFVERMGLMLQREGMPRIAGKIWGVLVMRDEAFSFSCLAEYLQVSRASISTNTRLLEELSVIERVGQTGAREDFFRLRKRPYEAIMRAMQSRMRDAILMCTDTLEELTEDSPTEHIDGARSRLNELRHFYQSLHQMADQVIEQTAAKTDLTQQSDQHSKGDAQA